MTNIFDRAGSLTLRVMLFTGIVLFPVLTVNIPFGRSIISEAYAEPEQSGINGKSATPEDEGNIIDKSHKKLTENILSAADRLDSFFDNERIEAEENETRLRLKFSSVFEQYDKPDYDLTASLKLSLPRTEKRLSLVIAGDPYDEYEEPQKRKPADGLDDLEDRGDRDIYVSLLYTLKETLQRKITASTGVRFSGMTPVAFAETIYRQTVDLDSWTFRFTQSLKWLSDDGAESGTTFDFEKPLTRIFFFRTTAEGTWYKREDGYFYNLDMFLFQSLSPVHVIEYGWVNSFRTGPNRLEETVLRARYRQRIWREWFYFEIVPRLSFPRDNDYRTTPGILFRLEAIVGAYEGKPG